MPLTVTIVFQDDAQPRPGQEPRWPRFPPGVDLQLLDNGGLVATARSRMDGTVTFDVDPSTLTGPAVRLAPKQTPPA